MVRPQAQAFSPPCCLNAPTITWVWHMRCILLLPSCSVWRPDLGSAPSWYPFFLSPCLYLNPDLHRLSWPLGAPCPGSISLFWSIPAQLQGHSLNHPEFMLICSKVFDILLILLPSSPTYTLPLITWPIFGGFIYFPYVSLLIRWSHSCLWEESLSVSTQTPHRLTLRLNPRYHRHPHVLHTYFLLIFSFP